MSRLVKWISNLKKDKLLHFICGAAVSQVAFAATVSFTSNWIAALISVEAAVLAGACKEWWDVRHGVPSWKDFLATVLGGVLGAIVPTVVAI